MLHKNCPAMSAVRNALVGVVVCLCTSTAHSRTSVAPVARSTIVQEGKASWYSVKCNGGTRTASGEALRDSDLTAAHKTLPMGSKVRVTNKVNGRSVIVRITDRGPYIKGRIIDVTKAAAQELGFLSAGITPVTVEVL
jgi:rare lipoprotein A